MTTTPQRRVTRTTLAFHATITLLTYLDFALVRQAFCKYLCPYARFQSVLFDRDTLVVAYDPVRGDPRGKAGREAGYPARAAAGSGCRGVWRPRRLPAAALPGLWR